MEAEVVDAEGARAAADDDDDDAASPPPLLLLPDRIGSTSTSAVFAGIAELGT